MLRRVSEPGRTTRLATWAPALVLCALVLLRVWTDVIDDAWITFRAAENAARGEGLTFNPGEPPVESFSNPLLALVLWATASAGLPSIWVARALGLLGLGLAVRGSGRLVSLAGGGERAALLASAATLGSFPLVFYAWTGLETTLYAGLVTAAVWRWLERGERLDPLGALLFFLVALSRPEAPLVLLCFFPLLGRDPDRRRTSALATLVLCALAALVALRLGYYGDLVPNTFHAKSAGSADHDPTSSPLFASLAHVGSFALALGVVLPAAALFAPLGRGARARAIAAPVLGCLLFALYAGGDWMPGARYLAPAIPLVAALGALGLEALARRGAIRRPGLAHGLALAAALAGSAELLLTATLHRDEFPYPVLRSTEHLAAAREMRALLPPRARVIAFRIGALGWAGDFDVVDLLGLADREVARIAERHPEYHPQRTRMGEDLPELRAYVASRDADALLLVTEADASFDPAVELYGQQFTYAGHWPLGVGEAWALYRRER